MELTEEQKKIRSKLAAFIRHPEHKECNLIGAGGVGKGVLLSNIYNTREDFKVLCNVMGEVPHTDLLMTATTNEAANVLLRKGVPAKTIYRKLGIRPEYGTDKLLTRGVFLPKPLTIFVDEASMVSKHAREVIREQAKNNKIVWVLDDAQLAPVGEDLPVVSTLGLPEYRLENIMRSQGILQQFNTYLRNCVLKKELPMVMDWANGDTIQVVDANGFQSAVNKEFIRPDWEPSDSRILAYSNKCVDAYGKYVVEGVRGGKSIYAVGSYLRQKGYSQQYNDGAIVRVDSYEQCLLKGGIEGYRINGHVGLKNPTKHNYKKLDAMNVDISKIIRLTPIYSSTVHAAQGSTIDTVFLDMRNIVSAYNQGHYELYRRLIYTGVSRAANKVIIRI